MLEQVLMGTIALVCGIFTVAAATLAFIFAFNGEFDIAAVSVAVGAATAFGTWGIVTDYKL